MLQAAASSSTLRSPLSSIFGSFEPRTLTDVGFCYLGSDLVEVWLLLP